MNALLKRNIKLFFRDKANVFFSMLSVLIIIALFALVFGVTGDWHNSALRDSWVMAGVLAVASLTTSLTAFSVSVEDKVNKTAKGFYASPVRRSSIAAAYILSPFIVSVIMTTGTAGLFAVYFAIGGQAVLSVVGVFKLAGLILLSGLSCTAMVYFMVSFIKRNSVFGTVNIIIGSLAPFLMGVYISIGSFPRPVQVAMMLFPPSQAAMLFRQILMEKPAAEFFIGEYAGGMDGHLEAMGAVFRIGNFDVTWPVSVAYLVVTGAVFYGLAVLRVKRAR
jgi:multidrug/hemolysin transport system permease protein